MTTIASATQVRLIPVPPAGQTGNDVTIFGTLTASGCSAVAGEIKDVVTNQVLARFQSGTVMGIDWFATAKGTFSCGQSVEVTAWCEDSPSAKQTNPPMQILCCPEGPITYIVKDAAGNPVGMELSSAGGVYHVPPGSYTVEIVSPLGVDYDWTVGLFPSATSTIPRREVFVSDGEELRIGFSIGGAQGCPDVAGQVTLVGDGTCPDVAGVIVENGCAPGPVNLTADVTGDVPQAAGFAWNFGDGSPSVNEDSSPTHTYQQPGTYTVTVTVIPAANSPCLSRTRTFAVSIPACGTPPTNGGGTGGESLCCFLIYSWLGGFIVGMTAYKLGYAWFWVPLALAMLCLLVWIHKCCKRCLKIKHWYDYLIRPDKVLLGIFGCCQVVRWHILGHSILLAIVYPLLDGAAGLPALMGAVCAAVPVLCGFLNITATSSSVDSSDWSGLANWIVAAGLGFWTGLYYYLKCKAGLPVLYNIGTWPKCKCKKKA